MEGKHGPDIFDDPTVFDTYLSKRSNPANPNETLEKPILIELIGEMRGLKILDLGCGDAQIGREALEKGGSTYVGIEGSHNMASLARKTLAGTDGAIHHGRIEDWSFPEGSLI